MNAFKKILVALDLSKFDNTLIRYANYLSKQFDVEKIYFVHNIKKYEISEFIEQEIKDVDIEEAINDELNENIAEIMDKSADWELLISDDPYTESLINYISHKYNINTVLLGNKNGENGSGLVGFKLLRILKSSVLWIPQISDIDIQKIWVSTDLSSSSKKAFGICHLIQNKINAQAQAVHVYNMPLHFSPYINSSKIETKVENHVTKKFETFIKRLNYPHKIETVLIAGREANAASKIRIEAKKHKVSFLIVADKGANTFSNLMVGSVTEELFNRNLNMPLFITKVQNEPF